VQLKIIILIGFYEENTMPSIGSVCVSLLVYARIQFGQLTHQHLATARMLYLAS
jgi:hypothetical protein